MRRVSTGICTYGVVINRDEAPNWLWMWLIMYDCQTCS